MLPGQNGGQAERIMDWLKLAEYAIRLGWWCWERWQFHVLGSTDMRKPFNTTCDVFTGPNGTPPNTLRGTFACRLVIQDGIQDYVFGGRAPVISYWLTIQGIIPNGMFQFPQFSLDDDLGDRIAVPSGSPVRFAVLYTDEIVWKKQAKYWRAYLISLPFPTDYQGGVVLGGSASIIPPGVVKPSGGVVLGGHALIKPPAAFKPSGGVVLGGHALIKPPAAFKPSGGVVLGGHAKGATQGVHAGDETGGVVLGGHALIKPPAAFKPSGGVVLGGHALIKPPAAFKPSGGVVLGGVATVSFSSPAGTVYDSYTAANGTNATGRACDTGQVPTASGGGYTIISNQCSNSGNTSYDNPLVYESSISDCTVQVDLSIHQQAASGSSDPHYDGANLVFRYVNDNQLFLVQPVFGNVLVYVKNTTFSVLGAWSFTMVNDTVYTLKVALSGSSITVFMNGTNLGNITNTTYQTATKHGHLVKSDIGGGSSLVDNFHVDP